MADELAKKAEKSEPKPEIKKQEVKKEKPKADEKKEIQKQEKKTPPEKAKEVKKAPEVKTKPVPAKEVKTEPVFTLTQIREAWSRYQTTIKPFPETLKPETAARAEVKEEKQEEEEVPLLRSEETGDKVYYVHGKKRYWVVNPETLAKLGFGLGKERYVTFDEMLKYDEGDPVDLTIPGATKPWEQAGARESKSKDEAVSGKEVKPVPDKPYKLWT